MQSAWQEIKITAGQTCREKDRGIEGNRHDTGVTGNNTTTGGQSGLEFSSIDNLPWHAGYTLYCLDMGLALSDSPLASASFVRSPELSVKSYI